MPDELREHLDGLVQKYMAARVKEDHLKKRMSAMTARLRIALAEIMDKYYERFTHVETRRKNIIAEFLELWSKHLSGIRSVSLPSAVVSKRRDIKVTVLDKREVIDALDRLDRLDLVDEVIDEKGLRALARQGKLDDLPEGAIKVKMDLKIQAYRRKED
jgi:hypothetical protein